jgi:hypothetical protein
MGICLGRRRRIELLLTRTGDAIVRRARGVHQRRQFGEGFDGDQDRAGRQRGAGHAIRHPDRNRGGALILLAQPNLAPLSRATLRENRLAEQRMPRIVNGDGLSAVGGM